MTRQQQLETCRELISGVALELAEGGCHPTAIAAMLCAVAGGIYREMFRDEDLDAVVSSAAGLMVKGGRS
jgi:hypothetical protein